MACRASCATPRAICGSARSTTACCAWAPMAALDNLSSQKGLPNNRVAALFVDREGSLWAGTNAGLLRLRDAPFTTFNSEQGLSDDYVRALVQSRDGSIWIGTSRGLNRWRDGKVVDVLHQRRRTARRFDPEPAAETRRQPVGRHVRRRLVALARRQGRRALRHRRAACPGSNQIRALAHGAGRHRCGSARRAAWCRCRMASSACSARPRACRAISSSACTSRAMARCGSARPTARRAWSASAIEPIDLHRDERCAGRVRFPRRRRRHDVDRHRPRPGALSQRADAGARAWRRACRSTPCSRWSTTRRAACG